MIEEKCIPLSSSAEWKHALLDIKHSFAHTWESCYAMSLTTGLKTYLYSFSNDNLRIVCPIAERLFGDYIDIVTPYGFSGFVGNADFPDFPGYWSAFVKERGYVCGYIALNPMLENQTYYRSTEVYCSNFLYILDLTKTEHEIFENLDRNRKRQLKTWNQDVTHFIFDKAILTDFILHYYDEFLNRITASESYYFSRHTLSYLCGLDNVLMIGAGENGNVKAAVAFACTPYSGNSLLHVSLPQDRHYSTSLLWYGIRRLKELGIASLNLGGGITEDDSVAEYKRRFGCRKTAFHCLKQVYRPEIYEELSRRANVDPADRAGYFPPYRDPKLTI